MGKLFQIDYHKWWTISMRLQKQFLYFYWVPYTWLMVPFGSDQLNSVFCLLQILVKCCNFCHLNGFTYWSSVWESWRLAAQDCFIDFWAARKILALFLIWMFSQVMQFIGFINNIIEFFDPKRELIKSKT